MRKKLYVIITGIVIFLALSSTRSNAETIEELREQRKEAQEQISQNTLQIDELELQISDLMKEIQDLNDDIYKYEIEVEVLNREIAQLNSKIYDVEVELTELEIKYYKRKDILAKRIVAQYEAGDVVYLDFLLNSNGLIEFISNYYMIGEILEFDNELITVYEQQKEYVKEIKDELDVYKAELIVKKEDQQKSAIVLSNIKVVKNSQLDNLTEQERELQEEIDQYQKDVQRIEIELLMLLTENTDSYYVGGTLGWPVPGYTTLSYKYGMRIHPISGVYRMHMGIDIPAPTGTYFVATNDGVVINSQYNPSYGNMAVVDHGGGVCTLYAHGSERLVEVGDVVKRGQPVIKVGSTGISTGPHAHFEVRVNGKCVDPLEYLLKNNNVSNEVKEEQGNE